jgi:hypothetical protein
MTDTIAPKLAFRGVVAYDPEAIGHLDFAIGEFRKMKMQPSLVRALRHREILKA